MTMFMILLCSVHQNLDGIGEENEPMDTEVHVNSSCVCSDTKDWGPPSWVPITFAMILVYFNLQFGKGSLITPRTCARGKASICLFVVVGMKITRSRVLACYMHNESIHIGEKLVSTHFELLKMAY